MGSWTLRRAVSADADPLAECIQAAYAQYSDVISDLPDVSSSCAEDIAEHCVWVAEVGSHIVGGLVLIAQDDFLLLANVAVHPDWRGKGLGSALMDLVELEATALKMDELRLRTHIRMPENIALYKHLGWQEIGREGNTISMRKSL